MPYSNIEQSKKYHRDYQRAWRKRRGGKYQKWRKKYAASRKERDAEIARASRSRRKIEVLSHYSKGKPKCACCGEPHIEFLTIDHIERNGAAHRREIRRGKSGGVDMHGWLKKNKFPKGYQVLCWNCNNARFRYKICPHKQ